MRQRARAIRRVAPVTLAVPAIVLVALCVIGCPSRVKPGDDVATVSSDDSANQNDKYGQVEFAGPAGTEINVRDASGKIIYTGEVPFSVRLPAGAYTWSARFVDNQRTEDRPLAMMPGDDSRVDVSPAGGGVATDDTEGKKNAPLGEATKDLNKPWVPTEPLIPVGPGGKVGSQKAGPTKEATPKEGFPAGGTTGAEAQGLPTEAGGAANPGSAGATKPGGAATATTDE